jgi:hypothetical protein
VLRFCDSIAGHVRWRARGRPGGRTRGVAWRSMNACALHITCGNAC